MGIGSRTRLEQLAWEFIMSLCYDVETLIHLLEASQGLPVVKEAVQSPLLSQVLGNDIPGNSDMDVEVIWQVMEEAVGAPNFRMYPAAMALADGEIGRIISGEMSVDSGLLKLQRELNGLLKQ